MRLESLSVSTNLRQKAPLIVRLGRHHFASLHIAIEAADFRPMLPTLLAHTVGQHTAPHLDAQLPGQRLQHRHRHSQWVFKERAEITHRTELHGETEPVVLAALLRDQRVVGIVEVEVAGEVVG